MLRRLELYISTRCNFDCKFCYMKDSLIKTFDREDMSLNIGKKSIDFFLNTGQYKGEECLISFLGGEPLLNFDLIENLVEYTHRKFPLRKVDFLILSNGRLIVERIAEFIKKRNIKIRITCNTDNKSGCDMALDLLSGYKYLSGGLVLFDSKVDSLFENFLYLLKKGIKRFYFNPEFLYSDWKKRNLSLLKKQIKLINNYIKKENFQKKLFISYINNKYAQLKYVDPNIQSLAKEICVIQEVLNKNFVIMPNGDIFSCNIGITGDKFLYRKSRLGNIMNNFCFNAERSVLKLKKVYKNKPTSFIPCLKKEILIKKILINQILNEN